MATGGIVEGLGEFLTCVICYNNFEGRNPRILSCHHAFCLECLQDLQATAIHIDQSSKDEIKCPSCQKITAIISQSVEELPPYFQAHQVLDILKQAKEKPEYTNCMMCKKAEASGYCFTCVRSLCAICRSKHDQNQRYKDHISVDSSNESLQNFECTRHHELVETFCTDCYTRICKICLFTEHEEHKCTEFTQGTTEFSELEQSIAKKVSQAQENIMYINDARYDIDQNIEDVDRQIVYHQTECHKQIDNKVKTLRAKLIELKSEAHKHLQNVTKLNTDVASALAKVRLNASQLKKPVPTRVDISLHDIQGLIDELSSQLTNLQPFGLVYGRIHLETEIKDISVGDIKGSLVQSSSSKSGYIMETDAVGVVQNTNTFKGQVKLHKSENAWRPLRMVAVHTSKPEDAEKQILFRKVRSILNKLTPQKFKILAQQMIDLNINTEEKLRGVVDIIFEKAINDPKFIVVNAYLCKCITNLTVPATANPKEFVQFLKVLLNRCQQEFFEEKHMPTDAILFENMQRNTDEFSFHKRYQLEEENDNAEQQTRKRYFGIVRFIGELYKLKMLTENITHDCVFKLLKSNYKDSLEAVCILLSTIGKDIDHKRSEGRVDKYMSTLQMIVDSRKISRHLRFAILDLIELRKRAWQPRGATGLRQ